MRRKLIIGSILFVSGILLQIISDITDIWIIGVLGGILWPVGSLMAVNASMFLSHKKQSNDSSRRSTEQE